MSRCRRVGARRRVGPRRTVGGAGDSGSTLVEILVAVTVMATAISALLGALFVLSTGTDRRSSQAVGTSAAREYAERLAVAAWQDCPATYGSVTYTPPADWQLSALSVAYWDGTSFTAGCPGTDTGLQRITITMATTNGRASETLQLVKRKP